MSLTRSDDVENERELLLNSEDDVVDEAASGSTTPTSLGHIILYFMAIHFLLAFAGIILVAPLIRLFENSLCLKYYHFPPGGVEELLCKVPEVQRPLATIRGWASSFDMIATLLVAIPFGRLGDRYGRRSIMALALIGAILSLVVTTTICAFPSIFSLRLVWLSSIMLLCGGGLNAASAYMWALASESISSDSRSQAFYYIFSAFYVAEFLSSYVASVTIDISPWIPCGLSMISLFGCLLLLAMMPDTRQQIRETASSHDGSSSMWDVISTLSNRNVALIIPVFLVGIFRYVTLNVLIQYASIRFDTKISTGATFYTETALINIFLFLFLVPRLSAHFRDKYTVRPESIDLFLVRTSVILMCMGCLSIGLTQTRMFLPIGVLIFASGFGSRVSALSLVAYWISDDMKATFFATIVVLESLGHAVGDPAMQQTFAHALKLTEFWWALPFFVAAGLYFCATISTLFIYIDRKPNSVREEGIVSNHED